MEGSGSNKQAYEAVVVITGTANRLSPQYPRVVRRECPLELRLRH